MRWPTNGVAICTATNHQEAPTIASDGAGGAIISWTDRRGGYSDIYAQRINASGVVQWAIDGVAICTAMNTQSDPDIVSDGAGGAIITWIDYRTDNTGSSVDIYAQRVRSGGTLGDNSAPFAAAGTAQTVIINETVQLDGSGSNDPDNNSLTFAWTITLKPAGSNAALSNPASVTPTFVADVAGEYKVRLIVNDGTVNSAPDEALITAITAQDATQSLIDQVLALNKPQGNGLINGKLEVAIKRLDNNDIDGAIAKLQEFIDQVEVFIGNGTFTAEEGLPLIDAANEIIDALQASLPKLAQTIASPTEYRLEQNSPNPFNPSTTISFTLPEANEVSLAIYSLSGQLVKRLVAGEMSAGNHSMVWDATDDRGERVASGVYVFVLKAGEFTARRKLVLMK